MMMIADSVSHQPLCTGFVLKASFGAAQVIPEANGVAPQLEVTVTVTINPKVPRRSQGYRARYRTMHNMMHSMMHSMMQKRSRGNYTETR